MFNYILFISANEVKVMVSDKEDEIMVKDTLAFCTGNETIPLNGLDTYKVTIYFEYGNDKANTCDNTMYLPVQFRNDQRKC